jgi:hypothetical protein
MNWIDQSLLRSPTRLSELTTLYGKLVEQLATSTHDEEGRTTAATYANLWLVCIILEQYQSNAIGILSASQLIAVGQTKERCLLLLHVLDLFTDTPVELLCAESVQVETPEDSISGVVLWKFQQTVDFDKDGLVEEERLLVSMASTPIPEHGTESASPDGRWTELQDQIRRAWGRDAYDRTLPSSINP